MIVHCPTCNDDTILREGQTKCSWCDTTIEPPALPAAPKTGRSAPRGAAPTKVREPVVLEARRLYETGLSFRAVAAIIHPRTDYASVRSCAEALYSQFKTRGWPTRAQGSSTAAANKRRSLTGGRRDGEPEHAYRRRLKLELDRYQPRCAATIQSAGRYHGKPCARPAAIGSDFCQQHDPARAAARRERLDAMRANVDRDEIRRRRMAVRARAVELADQGMRHRDIARVVGLSPKAVGTVISRERRGIYRRQLTAGAST